jgi:hypothetical protein
MASSASPGSKKISRLARWIRRSTIALLIAVIVFYFTAPSGIGSIIGYKLKSELATRMKARLTFSSLRYRFPYGVRLEQAHLLLPGTNGARDSFVEIGTLDLSLAKLPLGTGPLVIENLAIDHPLVHLASPAATSDQPPAEPASPVTQKLSDLFQLRKITVNAGRFEYDMSTPNHPVPKIVWGHLGVEMSTQPSAGGNYNFTVSVQDQPIASASASGSFDIDALQLNLDSFTAVITADPTKRPEQVPPAVLDLIQKYQIAGQLTFQGSARMPLQSLNQTTFSASAKLTNAHCQPPGFAGPITPSEFTVTTANHGHGCDFKITAKDQHILSIDAAGSVDWNTLLLDLPTLKLSLACDPQSPIDQLPADVAQLLRDLQLGGEIVLDGRAKVPLRDPQLALATATVRMTNGHCRPVGWSGPVAPVNFSFAVSNLPGATATTQPTVIGKDVPAQSQQAHAWIKSFNADAGNQLVRLTSGQLDFDPKKSSWTLSKVQGSMDIGDGPGPLEGADVRIMMPFFASGEGTPGDKNSSVRIALDEGAAVVTPNHIRINHINGLLTARPDELRTSNITALCADGKIAGVFGIRRNDPKVPSAALTYKGHLQVSKLDLHQLALQYTTDPAKRQKAFGELNWQQDFEGSLIADPPKSGENSPADSITGPGNFDITNGYFLDIPILKDIVMAMHMGNNATTVGEVAGKYTLSNSVVHFRKLIANSPALGVQGHGDLGFDQQARMDFIAVPLADWAKDLRSTGMVGNAAATIVGKAQDIFNGLQGQLYSFRVTGLITNPKVEPVAVPLLTEEVGGLFRKMVGTQKQGAMAEELGKQKEPEQK